MNSINTQQPQQIVEVIPGSSSEPFSASSFLEYLRPSHPQWHCRSDDNPGKDSRWVFRGHRDASWKLVPSLWREEGNKLLLDLVAKERDRRAQSPSATSSNHSLTYEAFEMVYWTLLKAFVDKAEELALPRFDLPSMPRSPDNERHSMKWNPRQQVDIFDHASPLDALAQHHGIPTHLLDWTDHPFVAAFFAAHSKDTQSGVSAECCVWALNLDMLPKGIQTDNVGGDQPCPKELLVSPAMSSFLRNQCGLFTPIIKTRDFFTRHGKWPDFETAIGHWAQQSCRPTPILRKIVLRGSERKELLDLLHHERISLARLMPTLDNVAAETLERLTRHF